MPIVSISRRNPTTAWWRLCFIGLSLLFAACSRTPSSTSRTEDGGSATVPVAPSSSDGGVAVALPPASTSAGLERLSGIYSGTIGGQPIQVVLSVTGSSIQGTYFYQRIGKPLSLLGKVDPSCHLELTESEPRSFSNPQAIPAPTGQFQGTCEPGLDSLQGNWNSPDGKRRLPFKLDQLAFLRSATANGKGAASRAHLEISYLEFLPKTGPLGRLANETIAREVREHVAAFHQDFDQPEEPSDFEQTVGYQLAYNSEQLISVRVVITNDQPGGRSQQVNASRLFTLDEKGPRMVSAEALFVSPLQTSLSQITKLGEKAMEKVASGDGQPHLLPVVRRQELALTVTSRGLELYYVIPPADGAPLGLILPYDDLKEIILPTGALRSLVR